MWRMYRRTLARGSLSADLLDEPRLQSRRPPPADLFDEPLLRSSGERVDIMLHATFHDTFYDNNIVDERRSRREGPMPRCVASLELALAS